MSVPDDSQLAYYYFEKNIKIEKPSDFLIFR